MNCFLPVILFVGLPLAALAEESHTPAFPPRGPIRIQLNHEQVAMQMVIRKLVLDRYDADNNLRLDGEERHRLMADAHAARKQQALAFIRRFDTDGDGKLSPEERDTMKQAMAKHRGPKGEFAPRPQTPPQAEKRAGKRRGKHHHPHMGKDGRLIAFLMRQLTMDAYDADKNGILDTEESNKLRADGDALYEARKAELFARFDKDGNGRFSDEERSAALQELRPRRPQGAPNTMPPAPSEGELPPPPPRRKRGNPIHRLLDTHFDIDIILHHSDLPQVESVPSLPQSPQPCTPFTPSTN